MIRDLIRASIRTCDAATRAFEAMADAQDDAAEAFRLAKKANEAIVRERDAAIVAHDAYVLAERARESAWIIGDVSGSVVEFRSANKDK